MWEGISPNPVFSKPITIPVTNSDVIKVETGLFSANDSNKGSWLSAPFRYFSSPVSIYTFSRWIMDGATMLCS